MLKNNPWCKSRACRYAVMLIPLLGIVAGLVLWVADKRYTRWWQYPI